MKWIALSFLLLGQLACASGTKATSLTELIKEVWASSDILRAQGIAADLASRDRWRRFLINEPQFTYTAYDNRAAVSYGLALTTGFPGKDFFLIGLDRAKSDVQQAELRAKKYELTKLVVSAYTDCAAATAGVELQKTTTADIETLARTLKTLYETGHSTQAEKIGAELQARQANHDLVAAEDKEKVLCNRFKKQLSTSAPHVEWDSQNAVKLDDDLDASIVQALGTHAADGDRAIVGIELAEATRSTAWWQQAPDVTVSASRNNYLTPGASPNSQIWTTTFSLSVTLPLLFPFEEGTEARRTRAQATIDRMSSELQLVASDADQRDGAHEYQRDLKRLHELRSKDLALAEALMDSTFSAYRTGKLGYSELILARRTLTDLKNQEIQLRVALVNAHLRCLNNCNTTED